MKKLILILSVVVGAIQLTSAQAGSGFGIKGGLNYSSNGNYISSIGEQIKHPDRNVGFHLGVFGKFGSKIYLKTEAMYTQTNSSYNHKDFLVQKVDAPVLVGFRLIGPLSVFAGPAFQLIIDSKLDDVKAEDRSEDITMGLNFGFAVNIRRIGIDLRYERGFNDYEMRFITNNGLDVATVDARSDQLILSVSFKL
ncbi:conserved hypothetical protein containing N-terminal outer membrane beta-barrel domain [Formosa agariphila KMM 3901]|uniref:Outer membrane protein beta-barrel domain-containing protein n=1 Tax=Formosa agariphila (strain DSM 15362 / KCTC 12365 / LMG 23005 / KMM 3901 / M-2Alg 35-1) TaxID=1347342 RepID=T2KIA4_FORAG|nr:outer membrane beta-barrel protein [Formosa agariphila]CDF78602.1 conserved hypothetical protein containing N-terminal outer membrane beta-barrel domain [Formosa agariphila KMM 3901]